VKYIDVLLLLAKEEAVLQGMIDRLTEIGRCYGTEMNVVETKTIPSPIDYNGPKTAGECRIFQLFG
jgi:hypothetical protein